MLDLPNSGFGVKSPLLLHSSKAASVGIDADILIIFVILFLYLYNSQPGKMANGPLLDSLNLLYTDASEVPRIVPDTQ